MTTRSNTFDQGRRPEGTPAGLMAAMGWQVVLALSGIALSVAIWQAEVDFNLAPVIKGFAIVIVLFFGLISLVSVAGMMRGRNSGRLMGMGVNAIGAILCVIVLGQVLGLYIGIDAFAEAVYEHANWLLGLIAGYVIMWIGRRFDESSKERFYIERFGIGVLLLSLMILLLVAGLPAAVIAILGSWLTLPGIVITIVGILFGVAFVYLSRQGQRFGETVAEMETWEGWLFVLPNFIAFMIFFALPLLLSFYLSFTNYGERSLTQADWVGFRNYADILSVHFTTLADPATRANEVLPENYGEVFRANLGSTTLLMGARDPLFWNSLANTVRYVFLLVSLAVLPALLLAMILNAKVPGMKVFRALFFLPSIAAVVGVGLVWLWLYNPVVGFINYAITGVTTFFGWADPKVNWLTDDNVMLFAVVIMAAWQVIGFNTVIFLAGLQGINREVMEAALVDGASSWIRFTRIMLPLLAPTTFFVLVTTLISGLQAFSEFFVLLGTSTSNARLTTVYYLYLKGFRDIRFGYASSTAWVLFAVIFVVTLIQFRLSSRADAYQD